MHIEKTSGTNGQTQFSEIQFIDSNETTYEWPIGTTCYNTVDHMNVGTFGVDQFPNKLIDGNISTKMCAINLGNTRYVNFDIYIDLCNPALDILKFNRWRWWTGDDNPGRDPMTFSLYMSNDASRWTLVDYAEDVAITNQRHTIAYVGQVKYK